MTLNKSKQDQIFILFSQGKMFQEIADELGISVGAAWNYINGNHKNEKREPHKQAVPPQPGVIPKEVSLSAMKVNTVPQHPVETNILRTDYYTQWQLLQNAIQQDKQEEQNKLAEEYRKQQSEDRKQAEARADEHQRMMNHGIAKVEQLMQQKEQEERDQTEIEISEMRNRFIQNLNKPSKIPQETQSDKENRKPSEEQAKVKIPITEPESPPQEIQKNTPDRRSEEVTVEEKPLVIPSMPQRNPFSEIKKTSRDTVDYGAQILVKSFTELLRPWVNPNNETTKQTGVLPVIPTEPNATESCEIIPLDEPKQNQIYNMTDVIRNTIPRYLPDGFTWGDLKIIRRRPTDDTRE